MRCVKIRYTERTISSWFIFRATVGAQKLRVLIYVAVYFFSDYRSCAKNVEIIQASRWAEEFAIHIADAVKKSISWHIRPGTETDDATGVVTMMRCDLQIHRELVQHVINFLNVRH